MKLISKFHDYYDTGLAFGQDDEVTWIRTTTETECNPIDVGIHNTNWFESFEWHTKNFRCTGYSVFIAFCGSVYRSFVAKIEEKFPFYRDVETMFSDSREDLKERFLRIAGQKQEETSGNPHYRWNRYSKWREKEERARVQAIQEYLKIDCNDLHIKYDCPVLLFEGKERGGKIKLIKCPVLRDVGFQRYKDAFSAYQDIAMYISGVMGQKQNPMVPINDKSMILKKGFDPVYGFRTRPTK